VLLIRVELIGGNRVATLHKARNSIGLLNGCLAELLEHTTASLEAGSNSVGAELERESLAIRRRAGSQLANGLGCLSRRQGLRIGHLNVAVGAHSLVLARVVAASASLNGKRNVAQEVQVGVDNRLVSLDGSGVLGASGASALGSGGSGNTTVVVV
jgi:hypothetical protein